MRPALSIAPTCLLSAPSLALAATEAAPAAVGMSQLAQVLGALALVLVMIFGLAIASQRLRLGRGANGRHLRILDALSLGARERLLLVDVAGERVLLGVAGGRIERLHVLAAGVTDAAAAPFPQMLDAALGASEATP